MPQTERAHQTLSALAPLLCFVFVLTLAILFRIVISFGALTAWCVETDEFWYSASGGNWPLVGSFFLVLFMLFVWNAIVGFNEWRRSLGTRIMVIANGLGIAAMFLVFGSIHDSATHLSNKRGGLYDNILFRSALVHIPYASESVCVTARRFEGRWQVIDRDVGIYGFDIPAQWIELKRWGYAYAQDASWSAVYAGRWRPPQQWHADENDRWFGGFVFNAPWDFELRGDILVLTTPEYFELELQRSRITLQRIPIPEEPAYPNPHAAY